MNIKGLTYTLLTVAATCMPAACSVDDPMRNDDSTEGIEMTGISASMTRAVQVAELEDYVGKKEFDNEDRAVFITIKRTGNPIQQFTYSNIEFVCTATTSDEGVTSIGWSRDKNTGSNGTNSEAHPDRIYWSDATSDHTFTGYCAPQQGGGKAFDWAKRHTDDIDAYYGSIGDPTDHADAETFTDNSVLRKNDILLTHSTEIKAEDAIAKLYFYHGLAQVRVIVNISNFAAGGGDDTKSVVSDMVLKQMLTMYKWRQLDVATQELNEGDQTTLNEIYGQTDAPAFNQRKDFNLWIPNPVGIGEKSSRTFTFYGMAVPTRITDDNPLAFSFKVTYPDPMKPDQMKTHDYQSSIKDIRFDAGKCTTINISLNHRNEKLTVGAEYDDWEFINVPDQGELKKNSTFLDTTERDSITIMGDAKANVDDATWLYVDPKTQKILDVYGNDGSAAHPFQISTAYQLLAFAYEVKGGTTDMPRTPLTYKDLSQEEKTISGAFDFTGYHVALDAGLTLQDNTSMTKQELKTTDDDYASAPNAIEWIGIGDVNKPFNGKFDGGVRFISRLYGAPFFAALGPQAHVEQLTLEQVIEVNGNGGFAEINEGVICACKVDGDVKSNTTDAGGSFVGTNSGLVFACYHVGNLTAKNASAVGGLIGCNKAEGRIVASYNFGNIQGPSNNTYGVLGQDNSESGASVVGCFYDRTKASAVTLVAPSRALSTAYPSAAKTTVEIMRSTFAGDKESTDVTCLNGIINHWAEHADYVADDRAHFRNHYYVPQPAGYPYVF